MNALFSDDVNGIEKNYSHNPMNYSYNFWKSARAVYHDTLVKGLVPAQFDEETCIIGTCGLIADVFCIRLVARDDAVPMLVSSVDGVDPSHRAGKLDVEGIVAPYPFACLHIVELAVLICRQCL